MLDRELYILIGFGAKYKKNDILLILPIHFNFFLKDVGGIFLLYIEKVLGKVINNLTYANQNISFFLNMTMIFYVFLSVLLKDILILH